MVKKMKNILSLTNIFLRNLFQNPYIIDRKTNKINKKSIFLWLIIVVIVSMAYLSLEIIQLLVRIGKPTIFLNFLFIALNIIMIFQVILTSINVYFFSKDLELLLPLPIKSEEILISRFNTILINLYFSELMFAIVPLIIYGILTFANFLFYFYLIIILLIFPILVNLIISIVIISLIKIFRFIKNKDFFQVIVTVFIILIMFLLEFKIAHSFINKMNDNFNVESTEIVQIVESFNLKLNNTSKYFIQINPIINLLNNYNKINSIFYLLKIIFIDFIFFIIFVIIGKKYYLKNILESNKFYMKNTKLNNLESKMRKVNKKYSYIMKEFKLLFKNPIFFIQCIFPTLILMCTLIIIIVMAIPNFKKIFTIVFLEEGVNLSIDLSVICLILAIMQIIFTISNISITSISREGKNAIYMKFIPIDFYSQFRYKTMSQIIINIFLIGLILIFLKLIFPNFEIVYLIVLFVLSNLLNIINSKLMVLVDLLRPNLNWNSDYEAIKHGNNKLFQYTLTIIIVLLLSYFSKLFVEIRLFNSCCLITCIFIIFNFIINKIIKININKFFKKIN